jgi:hypothetical protein
MSEQNEREDLGLAEWHRQQSRIDELIAGSFQASKNYDELCDLTEARIESLQAQLTVAVEALEFYANLKGMTFASGGKATEAINTINKMKAGE